MTSEEMLIRAEAAMQWRKEVDRAVAEERERCWRIVQRAGDELSLPLVPSALPIRRQGVSENRDIVERLRAKAESDPDRFIWLSDAADEIERLRALLDAYRSGVVE
jgi:hypothetical protein